MVRGERQEAAETVVLAGRQTGLVAVQTSSCQQRVPAQPAEGRLACLVGPRVERARV